jgi:hypothetical protein
MESIDKRARSGRGILFVPTELLHGDRARLVRKTFSLGDEGFEHLDKTTEKQGVPQAGGAESGARDDDLAELLAKWPTLAPAKRRVIMGIVRGR